MTPDNLFTVSPIKNTLYFKSYLLIKEYVKYLPVLCRLKKKHYLRKKFMSRIIHFEIPATNPEQTIEFYSKTFGWTFTKWGEEEYWLVTTGKIQNTASMGR